LSAKLDLEKQLQKGEVVEYDHPPTVNGKKGVFHSMTKIFEHIEIFTKKVSYVTPINFGLSK